MYDLWLLFIRNSLVMSAVVVLALGLTRLLRKKTPPRLRVVCWVLIMVGFIIPVRPSLFAVTVPEATTVVIVENVARQVEGFTAPAQAPVQATTSTDLGGAVASGVEISPVPVPSFDEWAAANLHTTAHAASRFQLPPIRTMLPYIWAAGALAFIGINIAGHIRFTRKIKRRSQPVTNEILLALLNDACKLIGLKRPIRLFSCTLLTTPVLMGLVNPKIILPAHSIPEDKLRLMLMHEGLHYKRGDLWVKALGLIAMAAHWFNPVVYLMNRALDGEIETACDRDILQYAGAECRLQYGRTVFETAKQEWQPMTALASAFTGSGKRSKQRLRDIIELNRPKRWVMLCCAAVMLLSLVMVGVTSCGIGRTQGYADLAPTDELVIYLPNTPVDRGLRRDMEHAIRVFQQRYRHVNVIVELIGSGDDFFQQYTQRINVELMAGTGPDLILIHPLLFPDIYRTIESSAFLDLAPIISQDDDFTMMNYVRPVLDAGLHRGGRYFMPYSFTLPTLFGLTDAMQGVGFDPASNTGFIPFFEELAAVTPSLAANNAFLMPILTPRPGFRYRVLHNSGLVLVDRETNEVLPDLDALRAFSEAFKPFWEIDQAADDFRWPASSYNAIESGAGLFMESFGQYAFFQFAEARWHNSDYALLPILSMDGELNAEVQVSLAIRAGSPNQYNAWNFIKTMLSTEVQNGPFGGGPATGFPVNQTALARMHTTRILHNPPDGVAHDGTSFPRGALTPDDSLPLRDLFAQIDGAFVETPQLATFFFFESMAPWFNNERSFEDSVEELRHRLMLYVSE